MKNFTIVFLFLLTNMLVNAQTQNLVTPIGSGAFGYSVTVLTNGNYVVADPYFDDGALADVGAIYLYNGNTHALISTLKGSTVNDNVGLGGIKALTNGNFVVSSYYWNNGATAKVGAATWCSGTTGLNGVVSSSNSLVGSKANDYVGIAGITTLNNGNYVVSSQSWDNGTNTDVGAVTWCSGTTGRTGVVSTANSLVGTTAGDQVGTITALANGNYVVGSLNWDNGSATNAGALTWCSGTAGLVASVSASNSLVGSKTNDNVGDYNTITALANGNYVVCSSYWDNGGSADAGAVTWCSGTTGKVGNITVSNSLVSSVANDYLGNYGVKELTNGNYVVCSPNWNNGAIVDAGAATWCDGTTGRTGTISGSNSIIGSSTNDQVGNGRVTALTNGHYVVGSYNFKNGTIVNAGAATWCNGATGTTGAISSGNSLVGSTAQDAVGNYGSMVALSNGNYVVGSTTWDNGSIVDAGALTWCTGTINGRSGTISSSNSLVGSTAYDYVGACTPLTNGNYVARSRNWDNGSLVDVGAVTWCNGTTGRTGLISGSNSIIGSATSDFVGVIYPLTNGNYVIGSISWDNGTATNAGAVTWCNGTAGATGTINSSNSLIGTSANDNVGYAVIPLTNGNFVAHSPFWDNNAIADVGAVTWCDGTTVTSGSISSSNSLVGNIFQDRLGFLGNTGISGVTALTNGGYLIKSPYWDNGGIANACAITWGNGTNSTYGYITSCNSVVGTTTNTLLDESGNVIYPFTHVFNTTTNNLLVGRKMDNTTSILNINSAANGSLAVAEDSVFTNIGGTGSISLMSGTGCRIIATLLPNGAAPVNGTINAKTWVETSVPTVNGQPYVARHYQITPASNTTTATAKVTLYFSQQEFDDFNAISNIDLPTSAADAAGIANVRIGKYAGSSGDYSGNPASYAGTASVIDPADADVVWNATVSRWEISFDVTGFSGFVVQTTAFVLPLKLLYFNAIQTTTGNLLRWATADEHNTSLFEMQKSTDGSKFNAIANKKAVGNGNNNYSYTDSAANNPAIVYYRLKMLDNDGQFTYSPIISIANNNVQYADAHLEPTIAATSTYLQISNNNLLKTQARLVDMYGKTIQTITINSSLTPIDVAQLPNGLYFLQLQNGIVLKLVRQ